MAIRRSVFRARGLSLVFLCRSAEAVPQAEEHGHKIVHAAQDESNGKNAKQSFVDAVSRRIYPRYADQTE